MGKYTSEFTSIDGRDFKVEIETKGSGSGTFLMSGEPLASSMDSDGKTMYAPVKTTGMTVGLLTKDLPFDLYSGDAMGVKVKVYEGTKVIWAGFNTPCAYTQGFDQELEEVQLECVDGLAVLKEIPYQSAGKEISTFLSIFHQCVSRSGCFKTLYVSNDLQLTSSANDSIMEKIRVSEANFFDDKEYEAQPDDDVAMSCYDVLFELMQYMCSTLIADGEDLYILSYDAIRQGKNTYYKYDISGSAPSGKTSVTLKQDYAIGEDSYAETGCRVDLSEVFNQLQVTDDFHNIDSMVDGLNEAKNWTNITATSDPGLTLPSSVITVKNKAGEDESMVIWLTKNWAGRIYFVLCKFYKNPLVTTYHYAKTTNALLSEANFNPMTFTKMMAAKGATLVGYFTRDIDQSTFDTWWRTNQSGWPRFTNDRKLKEYGSLCGLAQIESKKLDNYVVCLNQSDKHIGHDDTTNYPYFKVKKSVSSLFGGAAGYLCIQGTVIRHDEPDTPFPMQHKDDVSRKNTSIYKNEGFVYAQLRWGDKYWEEESHFGTLGGDWTTRPVVFRLFYGDITKEIKANDFMDRELEIYNTAAKIWGVDDTGYYVPAPKEGNLAGEVELTIFANKDTKGKWDRKNKKDKTNSYDGYPPYVMMYKNLDIKIGYADDALNEEAASADTVYINEVEDYSSIKRGEDVDVRICTFDDKTPSYSTVDYIDSEEKSQYLDKVYSQSTGLSLRAEEHIIYKTVNQYQEPRCIYEANLKDSIGLKPYCLLTDKTLSGKKFVLDTIQRNYKYNKAEVRLIEKSNVYK